MGEQNSSQNVDPVRAALLVERWGMSGTYTPRSQFPLRLPTPLFTPTSPEPRPSSEGRADGYGGRTIALTGVCPPPTKYPPTADRPKLKRTLKPATRLAHLLRPHRNAGQGLQLIHAADYLPRWQSRRTSHRHRRQSDAHTTISAAIFHPRCNC